jgi:hypothetical protein
MIVNYLTVTLCVLSVPTSNAANDFVTQCFLPTYHHGISNAEAIAELWNVSPFECLKHCVLTLGKIGKLCASVVYHRHFSTCQLYGHDGTLAGAQVVYAAGHDYYNRTSYDAMCHNQGTPSGSFQRARQFGITQHSVEKPIGMSVQEKEKITEDYQEYDEPRGHHHKKPTGHLSQQRQPPPVVVKPVIPQANQRPHYYLLSNDPISNCGRTKKIAYLLFDNHSIAKSRPRAIVEGVNIDQCLAQCSQNVVSPFEYLVFFF